MTIGGAVDWREPQPRHEQVIQLFPDLFGIRFFGFRVSFLRSREKS